MPQHGGSEAWKCALAMACILAVRSSWLKAAQLQSIGVPIDCNCAAFNQEDLTASIHAMASAHFHASEPPCCGIQLLEKPARLVGKRPAKFGKARPAFLYKT